jgi:hypothetical protein
MPPALRAHAGSIQNTPAVSTWPHACVLCRRRAPRTPGVSWNPGHAHGERWRAAEARQRQGWAGIAAIVETRCSCCFGSVCCSLSTYCGDVIAVSPPWSEFSRARSELLERERERCYDDMGAWASVEVPFTRLQLGLMEAGRLTGGYGGVGADGGVRHQDDRRG